MPNPPLTTEEAERRISLVEDEYKAGNPPSGQKVRGRFTAIRVAATKDGASAGGSQSWYRSAVHVLGREADASLWVKPEPEGRASYDGDAPDGYLVKGRSTYYGPDGSIKGEWVKTTADQIRQEEMAREFVEALAVKLPKYKPVKPPKSELHDDLMSIIPMGDPHFGLYCWAAEVGNDFNLEIAEHDLCAAVEHLVKTGPPSKRCVIVNLGDFFHADNMEGTTSRSGNVLDMDTRLGKVIDVGVRAMRHCIAIALAKHERVEVINAIGNHDDVLSLAMSVLLANVYENEPRITVHNQPTSRHYIQHGKVLIGITHGHQTKDKDLPGIMATEKPEEWGASRYRYWYRGHHHHDESQEYPGCKVEQFRTLAPGDAYAVGHGYLSGRDMKLIVHHSEYGECARSTCSIDMLRNAVD